MEIPEEGKRGKPGKRQVHQKEADQLQRMRAQNAPRAETTIHPTNFQTETNMPPIGRWMNSNVRGAAQRLTRFRNVTNGNRTSIGRTEQADGGALYMSAQLRRRRTMDPLPTPNEKHRW